MFVQTAYGTVLRDRPFVNNPNTPLQQATRHNLARVGATWRGMNLAQAAAWREFATREPGAIRDGRVQPNLLFTRLAMKFLQVHPDGVLPLEPPASLFPGDAVRFQISLVGGRASLLADRDNAPGVVTEVLIQPLASVHRRTYAARYRTAGFFAFRAGVPVSVEFEGHVCAVAVRFVCAATGQATGLMELGVVP